MLPIRNSPGETMARRRKNGWTKERLSELIDDFAKMLPAQLVKKYGYQHDTLVAIHDFAQTEKRLHISTETVTEIRNGKPRTYTIARYAPAFAEGSHRMHD